MEPRPLGVVAGSFASQAAVRTDVYAGRMAAWRPSNSRCLLCSWDRSRQVHLLRSRMSLLPKCPCLFPQQPTPCLSASQAEAEVMQ